MKRIIAVGTSLCLLLGGTVSLAWDENRGDVSGFADDALFESIYKYDVGDFVKENEEEEQGGFSEEIELVLMLDMMSLAEEDNFAADELLSYSDFYKGISMLYKRTGIEGIKLTERDITMREAVTTVMSALGYDYFAGSDILKTAEEQGLLEKLTFNADRFITRGEFAQLLFNALNCSPVKMRLDGADVKYDVDETVSVLNKYFDVYRIEGVLNAVGELNLFGGTKANPDCIQIERITISVEDIQELKEFFAQRVFAYAKLEDEEYRLMYLDGLGTTETIAFSDIVQATDDKIYYTKDDGTQATAKLSEQYYMLYNGDPVADWEFLDTMTDKHGSVTIRKAFGKQKYDTVVIKSYNDYMISTAFAADKKMTLNYGAKFGDSTTLNLDDDSIDLTLTVDGKQADFSALEGGMAMSIFKSKSGKYIEIHASTKRMNGKVSEKLDSNKVVIDGTEYMIAEEYLEANKTNPDRAKEIKLGIQGVFYLTFDGVIAGMTQKNGNETYAVLIKAYVDEDSDKAAIKVFNEYGDFERLTLKENATLDGVRYSSSEDLINALKSYVNLEYKVDYDYENDGVNEDEQLAVYPLISYSEGSDGIKKINTAMGQDIECNGMYKGNNTDWMGAHSYISEDRGHPEELKHRAGESTVAFVIPEEPTKENEYKVTNGTADFSDMQIQYFNENEFFYAPYIVAKTAKVMVDNSSSDTSGTKLYVTSLGEVYEDDEIKKTVNGYSVLNNVLKKVSYVISDELAEAVNFQKGCIYNVCIQNSTPYSATLFFTPSETDLYLQIYHGATRVWNSKGVIKVLAIDPSTGWILFDRGTNTPVSAKINFYPVKNDKGKLKQVDYGEIEVGDKLFVEYKRGYIDFIYIIPKG